MDVLEEETLKLARDCCYRFRVCSACNCSGAYEIYQGVGHAKNRTGFPIWKHTEKALYMFSGTNRRWIIGDDDEATENFESDTGLFATSKDHHGMMPYAYTANWLRFDEEDDDWKTCQLHIRRDVVQVRSEHRTLHVFWTGDCRGTYEIVEDGGRAENQTGFPIWKHTEKTFYIFSGVNKRWIISDEEVVNENFESDTGLFATSETHQYLLPHEYTEGWLRFDEEDDAWKTCQLQVRSNVAQEDVEHLTFHVFSAGDCTGSYELYRHEGHVENQTGFPIWKHTGRTFYMFSGTNGRWLISDEDEARENFESDVGLFASSEKHHGIMPNKYSAGWLRFDEDWKPCELRIRSKTPQKEAEHPDLRVLLAGVCSGTYRVLLDEGHAENGTGFPIWKHTDKAYYMFSGTNGRWFIGDEDEAAENFESDTGLFATCKKHYGVMPHEYMARWLRLDEEEDIWKACQLQIGNGITLENAGHRTLRVLSAGSCSGTYEMFQDKDHIENLTGFPIWKHRDKTFYLFSGTNWRWLISDEDEANDHFESDTGLIVSSQSHRGVMPDKYAAGWLRLDQEDDRWKICRLQIRSGANLLGAEYHTLRVLSAGDCSGTYEMFQDKGHIENHTGFPIWKHRDKTLYMFSGTNGRWLISDEDEAIEHFKSDTGLYVASKSHQGLMPDAYAAGWFQLNEEDDSWKLCQLQIRSGENLEDAEHHALHVFMAGECSGTYEVFLDKGHVENHTSLPIWKHRDKTFYMFSGTNGRWLIGDEGEATVNFESDSGVFVASESHHLLMPDEYTAGWFRLDETDDSWKVCQLQIRRGATLEDAELNALHVSAAGECSGTYKMFRDEGHSDNSTGLPIWKHTDSCFCIFSGMNGRWLISDGSEATEKFKSDTGFFATSEEHHGAMPHKYTAGWLRFDEDCKACQLRIRSDADPEEADHPHLRALSSENYSGTYEMFQGEGHDNMRTVTVQTISGETIAEVGLQGPFLVRELKKLLREQLENPQTLYALLRGDTQLTDADVLEEETLHLVRDNCFRFRVCSACECSGTYEMFQDEGHAENRTGLPIWKHTDKTFYMFSGTNRRWFIGDEDEATEKFESETGLFAASRKHHGVMPHEYTAGWLRFDEEDDDWKNCKLQIRSDVAQVDSEHRTLHVFWAGDCRGTYEIFQHEGRPENRTGFPIWKHRDTTFYMFSGTNRRWIISDEEVVNENFESDTGLFATSGTHQYLLPHEYTEGWLRFDENDDDWKTCQLQIRSNAAQEGAEHRNFHVYSAGDCSGTYEMFQDEGHAENLTGFPIWKHTDKTYYMFSGTNGRWFISDEDEAAENFESDTGLFATSEEHHGVMPREFTAGWLRFDDEDDDWKKCYLQIRTRAAQEEA